MASPLSCARAIAAALRAARRSGQTPEAVLLSPELHDQLQAPALSYIWSSPARDVLFDVPVKVDQQTKGWAIRVR